MLRTKQILHEALLKSISEDNDFRYRVHLDDDEKKFKAKYVGRNIIWYGDPQQMIVIHKSKVYGMDGNIYYQDKLNSLVDLISDYDNDMVEIECSYGLGTVITLHDIIEEQESDFRGDYYSEFTKEMPLTIGDDRLDKYLGAELIDDVEDLSDLIDSDDLTNLLNKYKNSICKGHITQDKLLEIVSKVDLTELDKELLEAFISIENEVLEAVNNEAGDINEFHVQLRDGHHRIMASIESGEEYVCLNLSKDSIVEFKGYYTKVSKND